MWQSSRIRLRKQGDFTRTSEFLRDLLAQGSGVIVTARFGNSARDLLRAAISILPSNIRVRAVPETDSPASNKPHFSPTDTILIEYGDHVSDEQLTRLAEHVFNGGSFVVISELDSTSRSLLTFFEKTLGLALTGNDENRFFHVSIENLTDEEMRKLIQDHPEWSSADSATINAVVTLANGKTGWARELFRLAALQHLRNGPYPSIVTQPLPATPLPEVERIRAAFAGLTSRALCAAVILSNINPVSETSAASLFGKETVDELMRHCLLHDVNHGRAVSVEPFIGMALRALCPTDALSQLSHETALLLLRQEFLGFPLTGKDASFCFHEIDTNAIVTSRDHQIYTPTLSSLFNRVLLEHIQFSSHEECRAALFELAQLQAPIDPMARARMLVRTHMLPAALDVLTSSPTVRSTEEHAEYLFALGHISGLLDERSSELMIQAAQLPSEDLAVTSLSIAWNTASLVTLLPESLSVLRDHSLSAVRDSYLALKNLFAVWQGQMPPNDSWLVTRENIPIPTLSHHALMLGIVNTTVVANALTAFLSGEFSQRAENIKRSIVMLNGGDYHKIWLAHLENTDLALKHADIEGAAKEWSFFINALPQFTGLSITARVQAYGQILSLVSDSQQEQQWSLLEDLGPVSYQVLYFAGHYDLILRKVKIDFLTTPVTPFIQFATLHLTGIRDGHPAQLLKAGAGLFQLGMFSAAYSAVNHAKRIYLSRRSTGRVADCDALLSQIEAQVKNSPFAGHAAALPKRVTSTLTKREFEVAQLAAQGLSNKQIAESLQVKLRTVESHIAQARAKLGATTRKDIAALLPNV